MKSSFCLQTPNKWQLWWQTGSSHICFIIYLFPSLQVISSLINDLSLNYLKFHIIILVWHSGQFLLTASFLLVCLGIWQCLNFQDLDYILWFILTPNSLFQVSYTDLHQKKSITIASIFSSAILKVRGGQVFIVSVKANSLQPN